MPIGLRDDIMYILLQKIKAGENNDNAVDFRSTDFTGRNLTISDFLGHLDYLNQKEYIDADFEGNAYANQEDVPDAVDPETVDFRIANTFGAPDGPLPHLIRFKRAKLTDKGQKMLDRMEEKPPEALEKGPATAIVDRDTPFLEEVALKAELPDIFDARDLVTVVYRTMRDLMTTEAAKNVESELHQPAEPTDQKRLQEEIAQLWKDENPIVSWLSKVRPPLKFDDETFFFRIKQEGGLPKGTDSEKVIKAIFSATKDELSSERIAEIADFLPGKVKELWQNA